MSFIENTWAFQAKWLWTSMFCVSVVRHFSTETEATIMSFVAGGIEEHKLN